MKLGVIKRYRGILLNPIDTMVSSAAEQITKDINRKIVDAVRQINWQNKYTNNYENRRGKSKGNIGISSVHSGYRRQSFGKRGC